MANGSIITPQFFIPSFPGQLFSCTLVEIDAYSPVNYTPANSQLCGHLSGIDSRFGLINTALTSISATTVTINTYTPVYYNPVDTLLSSHVVAIDANFGNLDRFAPQTMGSQLFTDGDNGTFTANITGINQGGSVTLAQDNSVFHELSGSSLKATSTSTGTRTISHDNSIAFKNGKQYEISVYVFCPAGTSPTGANVSLTVSGTGSIRQVKTIEVNPLIEGKWSKISTRFFSNANQNANVTITITDFTNTNILNFDNLVVSIVPSGIGTQLSPYSFTTLSDFSESIGRAFLDFVDEGGTITTSPLNFTVTVDKSTFIVGGRAYYRNQENVSAASNSDNYLYYDSFNDRYLFKSVAIAATAPKTSDGEIALWKITTDFVGTTGTVDLRNLTPISGLLIPNDSITTAMIQNLAVTDAKMSTTGVSPASYIFSNITVNAQGRITAASSPVTITSVVKNNILQYDSGTGKWVNTANLTLEADASTLINNGTLESPLMRLIGYFDSDPGAGITATSYTAYLQHVVTSTVPDSRLAFVVGGSEYMSLTNIGRLGIGTTVPTAVLHVAVTGGVNTIQAGTDFYVTDTGNIGIGTSTFGTNAAKVVALLNGTAPTTSPVDTVQIWARDIEGVAGKSGAHLRTEDGSIHAFGDYHYFGDPAVDGSWRIGISATAFIIARREAGVWNVKDTILS